MASYELHYDTTNDLRTDKRNAQSTDVMKPGMGSGKLRTQTQLARQAAIRLIEDGAVGDPLRDSFSVSLYGHVKESEADDPDALMVAVKVVDPSKAEHPREAAKREAEAAAAAAAGASGAPTA